MNIQHRISRFRPYQARKERLSCRRETHGTMLAVGALAFLWAQTPGQAQGAAIPGQPYAPCWHSNDLLRWSPDTDPDAPYNRSGVPLAERFSDPVTQANPHAHANQARLVALAAFGPTAHNPSQGTSEFHAYAYSYWQYTHELVYWGGSASEGQVVAPKPTITDAAHRNGTRVLGTLFFPPSVYGGKIEWVRDLLQKKGDTFPVADKLIEAASYYGFDGWFINQETAGGDAQLAAQMRDFIRYLRQKSHLRILWYDAMTAEGIVRWQGELNRANVMFFEEPGRDADAMFLDFRWRVNPNRLVNSRELALSLKRDPYDLYAGIDVEANGYETPARWERIFPEGQPDVVSLGLYRPDWTFNGAANAEDFYQRDSRFWVGPNHDPSNTTTPDAWKGIAHYIPEQSPIARCPFVTNFNTGQGHLYAIDGAVRSRGDWNNLSLQDILPTWRWRVESAGAKLVPTLDWQDAYVGGTSLKVSGALTTANHIKLFSARLPVQDDTRLRLAYKTGVANAATRAQVGLAFADAPERFELLDLGTARTDGWNSVTFPLRRWKGKILAAISLRFQSPTPLPTYNLRVGQIAVFNGRETVPAAPARVTVEKQWENGPGRLSARLRWNPSPGMITGYNVYRRNPNGSLQYLGGTPNNAYFVANVARAGGEAETPLEVEAIGATCLRSKHAAVRLNWSTEIKRETIHR